jgi:hypothetical protein
MAKLIIDGQKSYIEDTWDLDDFRSVADGYDTETFTDDELIEAMERVVDNFDANLGINWDTIEASLDVTIWGRKNANK